MPVIRPTKPTTSKALHEAAVSLNNKIEKKAKRDEVLAEAAVKNTRKEYQSLYEASRRRETTQRRYADFSEAVKGKLLISQLLIATIWLLFVLPLSMKMERLLLFCIT